MLSTPKYGWSEVTIGRWSDRCSYLSDVPFSLLEAVEYVYVTRLPYALKLDAEGWEYIIVFDECETYIITDNESYDKKYINIEIDIGTIADELTKDINRDIDKWASWTDYGKMTPDEFKKRKDSLIRYTSLLMHELNNQSTINKGKTTT